MKKILIIVLTISMLVLCSCAQKETNSVITLENTTTIATANVETTSILPISTNTINPNQTQTIQTQTNQPVQTGDIKTREIVYNEKEILIFCDKYDSTTKKSEGIVPFQMVVKSYSYDLDKSEIKDFYSAGVYIQEGNLDYLFGKEGMSYYGAKYATKIEAKETLFFYTDKKTVIGTANFYDSEQNLKYTIDVDFYSNTLDLSGIEDGEYLVTIDLLHQAFEVVFADGTKIIPEFDMSYMILKLTK